LAQRLRAGALHLRTVAVSAWRGQRKKGGSGRAARDGKSGLGKRSSHPARCVALEIAVVLVAMIPERLCWHVADQERGKA
jgi:hypothetical protein